ncbi:hypothetical protein A3Q34_03775 [Colwellia sp. PAMC 20917]|nr:MULTISPECIES: hypothetical protein [unclassified Colwellia]AOW76049.1 hypothetical protein A3Q34_03775 [Colwellia sp. PAMC 20917]
MNQYSVYQCNVNSMLKNISFKSRLFLMSLLSLLITTPTMAGWEVNYIDTFSGDSVNWQN